MLPQYSLRRFSLCCEGPQACGLIHTKAELMSWFRSARRVFLRSTLFWCQVKLLKSVPLLIIFCPDLGTLKGKTVICRQLFINGGQGIWLFHFHLHLSLNGKQSEVFVWQEGRGKGMCFEKSYRKKERSKEFLLTDISISMFKYYKSTLSIGKRITFTMLNPHSIWIWVQGSE